MLRSIALLVEGTDVSRGDVYAADPRYVGPSASFARDSKDQYAYFVIRHYDRLRS